MTRLLVVGAHLDDAVLSCGRLLAANPGAVVCTVFAGRPEAPEGGAGPTEWDALCGFGPGDDVLSTRWAEDDAALRLLDANAVRLGFVDAQYATAPPVTDVAAALAGVLDRVEPERVLVPLGLFHRDHRWTAAAWLRLLTCSGPSARRAPDGWAVYADNPYRAWAPVRQRVTALARLGLRLGTAVRTHDLDVGTAAAARRAAAVEAYRSQRRGLRTLTARAGATSAARPLDADVVAAVRTVSCAVPGRCRP